MQVVPYQLAVVLHSFSPVDFDAYVVPPAKGPSTRPPCGGLPGSHGNLAAGETSRPLPSRWRYGGPAGDWLGRLSHSSMTSYAKL